MLAKMNWLQLFADGGNGGSAGDSGGQSGVGNDNGENDSIEIPASIPERSRKLYADIARKHRSAAEQSGTESSKQEVDPPSEDPAGVKDVQKEPSFQDLIQSDRFKEEREKYLNGVFKSRFSKIEAEAEKAHQVLANMAGDLGVDPNSKTLADDVRKAYRMNTQRVRQYAQEHDMPENEARRFIEMEDRIADEEAEKAIRQKVEEQQRQQETMRQQVAALQASAEKTKQRFPQFDLNREIQDERFARICAATGGDTTTAYIATHHAELFDQTSRAAIETAKQQVSQAVAANLSRPQENGLSQTAPSTTEVNFGSMNLAQMRQWYAEHGKSRG